MFAFCICDMFENPHFWRSFEFRGFGVRFCEALRRVQGDLVRMGCLVEADNRKLCQVMAPFTKTNLGLPILMQSLLFIIHIVEHYQKCKGCPDKEFFIYVWYINISLKSIAFFAVRLAFLKNYHFACQFRFVRLPKSVDYTHIYIHSTHSHIHSAHLHIHTVCTHTYTRIHIHTFWLLMCEHKVSSYNDRNWPAVPPSLSLLLSSYAPLFLPFSLSHHCRLARLTNDFRSRQRRRLT